LAGAFPVQITQTARLRRRAGWNAVVTVTSLHRHQRLEEEERKMHLKHASYDENADVYGMVVYESV
jgi:hypothetical protein